MVSDRRWKQLVREGKSLIKKAAKDRLILGAYAEEIEPNGSRLGDNQHSGRVGAAAPTLVSYAEEIDIAVDTLREYRDVLLKWKGDPERVPDISWTAMREIADIKDADPFEVYKAIKKEYGVVSSVTVRLYRGKAGWNHDTVKTKARQAKALMSDPDVASEAIAEVLASEHGEKVAEKVIQRTPKAEVAISKAQDQVARGRAQQRSDDKKTSRPAAWREEQMRALRQHLRSARRELEAANDIAAVLAPFTETEGEEVGEYVSWVGQWLGGLDATIRTGDIDEQLRKIVDGG